MKQGILISVVVILVLLLGIETGYIIKAHQDKKIDPARIEKVVPLTNAVQTPPAYQSPQRRTLAQDEEPEWDPFRELEEMQRMMNRMFRESYSRGLTDRNTGSAMSGGQHFMSYSPDIDFTENEKQYMVKIDLPGIDKNNITLKVENGQLIISGERKFEQEEKSPGTGTYRMERSFGSFTRSIPLPPDSDTGKMTALAKDGVLTVIIPKFEDNKKDEGVKKIPVM